MHASIDNTNYTHVIYYDLRPAATGNQDRSKVQRAVKCRQYFCHTYEKLTKVVADEVVLHHSTDLSRDLPRPHATLRTLQHTWLHVDENRLSLPVPVATFFEHCYVGRYIHDELNNA